MANLDICFSYCVYGENPIYRETLLSQLLWISEEGYKAVVFHDKWNRPFLDARIQTLKAGHIKLVNFDQLASEKTWPKKLYRFFPHLYIDADLYFIRDADHQILEGSNEELFLCKYWAEHEQTLCAIIRSSRGHLDPIIAGLFNYRREAIPYINAMSTRWHRTFAMVLEKILRYRYDQVFLGLALYPKIKFESTIFTAGTIFIGESPLLIHEDFFKAYKS